MCICWPDIDKQMHVHAQCSCMLACDRPNLAFWVAAWWPGCTGSSPAVQATLITAQHPHM